MGAPRPSRLRPIARPVTALAAAPPRGGRPGSHPWSAGRPTAPDPLPPPIPREGAFDRPGKDHRATSHRATTDRALRSTPAQVRASPCASFPSTGGRSRRPRCRAGRHGRRRGGACGGGRSSQPRGGRSIPRYPSPSTRVSPVRGFQTSPVQAKSIRQSTRSGVPAPAKTRFPTIECGARSPTSNCTPIRRGPHRKRGGRRPCDRRARGQLDVVESESEGATASRDPSGIQSASKTSSRTARGAPPSSGDTGQRALAEIHPQRGVSWMASSP